MCVDIKKCLVKIVEMVVELGGVEVYVYIDYGYLVIVNDVELIKKMILIFVGVVGKENLIIILFIIGVEDFSYYVLEILGMFFFLGVILKG